MLMILIYVIYVTCVSDGTCCPLLFLEKRKKIQGSLVHEKPMKRPDKRKGIKETEVIDEKKKKKKKKKRRRRN